MKRGRIGIWLARRMAVLVGVPAGGRGSLCLKVPRLAKEAPDKTLTKLLSSVPPEWRASDVHIALSPGDLACCDCFEVPFRGEREIDSTAASIIESRCAGESAEELAMDIRRTAKAPGGSRVQAIAIRHATLEALRSVLKAALPQAELKLVTGVTPVLAQAVSAKSSTKSVFVLAVSESLEAHIVCKDGDDVLGWRGFSFEYATPDFAERLQAEAAQLGAGDVTVYSTQGVPLAGKLPVEPALAAATAAALIDPRLVIDLLRGAKDAPKSSLERLKRPMLAACAAIILFCSAIGIYFRQQARGVEDAIGEAESIERKLGKELLHNEKPDAEGLLAQMNALLAERNKRAVAARFPSALSFWSEVAQVLPNPEQIGLVMDSLQLGHEYGQLIGHVSKGQDDALKNASLLEASLNRSAQFSAHGEFETKDTEILVRFRMDYHPQTGANAERKP